MSAPSPHSLWLGKAVPRYTSYPPATAFHAGVQADDYARSLAAIPSDAPISLYLHIPFCRALCLYCGCNTAITQRPDRVARYLSSLKRELSLVAGILGTRRRVSHLHFGGGTPNIMAESDIYDLLAHLRDLFDFAPQSELAMEIDPRTVTQTQVKALADCGITRVSLGVQDFREEVQKTVNRLQPYDLVARVNGWMREAGIGGINFDLMYGLPLQTPETVTETALQVCGLTPDRVSLFSYAHVPQFKPHQQALESYGLPDNNLKLVMEDSMRRVLRDNGYVEIGMDHFALPRDKMAKMAQEGTLRRNFQGYTDDEATTLLGCGATAIGQTSDGFFQNERDERDYMACVDNGKLAVMRGLLVTPADRLRSAIIEQLMCTMECDIEAVCRKHNVPAAAFDETLDSLSVYAEAGIIARNGTTIRLTSPHRMAIRVIAQAFDNYATPNRSLASGAA